MFTRRRTGALGRARRLAPARLGPRRRPRGGADGGPRARVVEAPLPEGRVVIAATWSASDTYLGITVAVLLILSGFFAVAETSLVRMNKPRARSLRDQGRHGAKALVELSESPEKFLNTIL